MNWTKIIQDLLDAGLTQAQIADSCATGQSHISGLYRGERKCPNYDLGEKILALHSIKCKKKAA
ncbi:MAG: hypothetical protein AAB649_04440 [Patescibacteria group bacterium]